MSYKYLQILTNIQKWGEFQTVIGLQISLIIDNSSTSCYSQYIDHPAWIQNFYQKYNENKRKVIGDEVKLLYICDLRYYFSDKKLNPIIL